MDQIADQATPKDYAISLIFWFTLFFQLNDGLPSNSGATYSIISCQNMWPIVPRSSFWPEFWQFFFFLFIHGRGN